MLDFRALKKAYIAVNLVLGIVMGLEPTTLRTTN
jgi:hypothetical protein